MTTKRLKKKTLRLVHGYIKNIKARMDRPACFYRNSEGKDVQFSPDRKEQLAEMQYIEQLILTDIGE